MSLLTFILQNLKYYRKSYLGVLAGTVISTAVLTGALVVGDSVRYSLGQLTDIRLGKSRFAIPANDRFFRQGLAVELASKTNSAVAPILHLEGMAMNTVNNISINHAEVLGMDERFMKLWDITGQIADDQAILSRNTADKLGLKPGDEILLKVSTRSKASANAPFIPEKEPLKMLRLKISAIADNEKMGQFSLKTNQSAPYNIFVSLKTLSLKVGLIGCANELLIEDNKSHNLTPIKLDSMLGKLWQPEDAGLIFRKAEKSDTYEIRSERIFIDTITSNAISKCIPHSDPVLTYLVNAISCRTKSTPYSFVTGASQDYLRQVLTGQEIIINDWLAKDLDVKCGDSLTLRYFTMGPLRKLTEDSTRFCIKTILPISDLLFDKTLMPDFPGMTDAGNCRDWETGTPIKLDKIRDKDEHYWNQYRGTPKALISISTAQKLWTNPFGNTTSFRFPAADSTRLQQYKSALIQSLSPSKNGLIIHDVYAEGKSAASNSTDFGGLFLGLSFFIIIAALLLIALIYSLHAQKRMAESAVLATIGFRKLTILKSLILEAAVVVVAGSILGTLLGILFNKVLLLGLNTLWNEAVRTSLLKVHLEAGTLCIGFISGIFTALSVLSIVLIRNLRKPISIAVTRVIIPTASRTNRQRLTSRLIGIGSLVLALVLLVYTILAPLPDPSEFFLTAGGLLLLSLIAWLNAFLIHLDGKPRNNLGFFTMVIANLGLNRSRNITAIAMLALGTFSVIITGSNHKTFYGAELSRQSGTGGFLFWAETTVPILYDLNSPEGKAKYGLNDEESLRETRFIQLLFHVGDDASCLNLNRVAQPSLVGVPPAFFDQQQAFSFAKLSPSVNASHPWQVLNTPLAEGIILGFADLTVVQWGLHKQIGDTLEYKDEKGNKLLVKLLGGLDNSIFQGYVLISSDNFRHYFPSIAGSKLFLVDGPFTESAGMSKRLSYLFQDYGIELTPGSERLAQFNSVENTYLSVFMLLGGLGILIGTIGLGIQLLQNLDERKHEISIYQATGLTNSFIKKLIFAENLFILFSGIAIGSAAALAGILPSLLSPSSVLPSRFLLFILILIIINALAWIYFPLKSALKKNLVQMLSEES